MTWGSRTATPARGRVAAVLAALLVTAGIGLAAPASACACGAYFTTGDAEVTAETAALHWDGTNEDLLISMNVLGSSPDAGVVIPVPAQAEVAVGDVRLLDELAQRTRPRVERTTNWWPNLDFLKMLGIGDKSDAGAATPSPTVTVLEQRQLGDFTVAQIAADDTNALADWLATNGYSMPPDLAGAMAPYASANWVFVAVKLTSTDTSRPITGRLQPVRLTFPSSQPVYPMRLSKLAKTPQTLQLYVLAQDRMDAEFTPVPGSPPTVTYAGQLDPGNMSAGSQVGQWVGEKVFLVRFDQTITDPSAITSDFTFTKAPTNEEYQSVVYTERDLGWLTGGLLSVLMLVLLAVIPTRIFYLRRVRRERAAETEG